MFKGRKLQGIYRKRIYGIFLRFYRKPETADYKVCDVFPNKLRYIPIDPGGVGYG